MDSPRATPVRNIALAAASTLAFAGLIEGAARWLEPPPVQREEYLWDWSERFKDSEFYTLEKGEGYPPNEETNVDGLRDFTRPVETREGLRRVVILGDSVTFGHGLEAAQAFPRLLEQSGQRADDVFNIALPGWSTRQERLAYERIARKYKPNAVILAVCLNDLAELQINLTKPSPLLLSLFKHSAAVRLALGASRREIGAVEELFTQTDSPRVRDAFRLFFDEVRLLRNEVVKDGASFHMIVFPFRFQVEPNAPSPTVQERIATFGATESIPVLDLLQEMRTEKDPAALFLDYDHFSVEGHAFVARVLDRELQTAFPSRWVDYMPVLGSARKALAEIGSATADLDEFTLWQIRREVSRFEKGGMSLLNEALVEVAVGNPSPRIRFEAARTVFDVGLPSVSSVPALIRGVQHEDPRVRAFATWTLGEMGEVAKPALPALVALARQDGGAGKTGALTAIGKIGGDSPETIPLLLEELKHTKEARRYRAARTLERMGTAAAPAVSGLIEALRDPSPLVRLHVVRAFASIGEPARTAVPALIEILNKDPDPEVRKEVSLTLSKLPGR